MSFQWITSAGIRPYSSSEVANTPRLVEQLDRTHEVTAGDKEGPSGGGVTDKRVLSYGATADVAPPRRLALVGDIMAAPIVTGSVAASFQEVWRIFNARKVRHLPLLDAEHKLVGIVSDRDLWRARAEQAADDFFPIPLRAAMRQQVLTTTMAGSVRDAAQVMFEARVGCLVVLTEPSATRRDSVVRSDIAGILTRTDILRALVRGAPIDIWV